MCSINVRKKCESYRERLVHCLAFKEITRTSQIGDDAFSDDPIFTKQARSTRKAELSLVQSFVSRYLIKRELIMPDVAMSKELLPAIRMR
jgi:hypothetical protein